MSQKKRKFADDGWAVWIDGEDTTTIHIHDWLNPVVSQAEIEDVSLSLGDTKILQAIFSAACIVDYKKNPHTSEIAYNGKTVDIVHISTIFGLPLCSMGEYHEE